MYGILLYSAFDCLKEMFGLRTARRIIELAEHNREWSNQVSSTAVASSKRCTMKQKKSFANSSVLNIHDNEDDGGRSLFSFHQLYSDKLLVRIAMATSRLTKMPTDQVIERFGQSFVQFCRGNGYDSILRAMGRTLRDFIVSLDNVHEYFRSAFPKMKPPSFALVEEQPDGMVICYRSQRGGFDNYVVGQLKEVAMSFFGIDINVIVLSRHKETMLKSTSAAVSNERMATMMKLEFDNMSQFSGDSFGLELCIDEIRGRFLKAPVLMEFLPFYICFNKELEILSIGHGLKAAFPTIVGDDLGFTFELVRPDVELTWDNILSLATNAFELLSVKSVEMDQNNSEKLSQLRLRGEMVYFKEFDNVIFLAMPVVTDGVQELKKLSLRMSDLSKADTSRDLISHRSTTARINESLLTEELSMAQQINVFSKEVTIYKMKRQIDLEDVQPSCFFNENYNMQDYQGQISENCVVVSCFIDENDLLENTDDDYKKVLSMFNKFVRSLFEFYLPNMFISPTSFSSLLDGLLEKYYDCAFKLFHTIQTPCFTIIVGPPGVLDQPCVVALSIANEILDMCQNQLNRLHRLEKIKAKKEFPIRIAIDCGKVHGQIMPNCNDLPMFCVFGEPVKVSNELAMEAKHFNSICWTHKVNQELICSELFGHFSASNYDLSFYDSVVTTVYVQETMSNDWLIQLAGTHRLATRDESQCGSASDRRGEEGGSERADKSSLSTNTRLSQTSEILAKSIESALQASAIFHSLNTLSRRDSEISLTDRSVSAMENSKKRETDSANKSRVVFNLQSSGQAGLNMDQNGSENGNSEVAQNSETEEGVQGGIKKGALLNSSRLFGASCSPGCAQS